MNYYLCMNYRTNVQGRTSHQHSLCGTIAHIQSSSLDKSLALDRYSIVRSPYTGSDEPCTHTSASLGKLKIFSPLDRSGDVASFGFGQIQLLPICLLATGAQRMLLQMPHSHLSHSVAELVGHIPQDEDQLLLHLLQGWPKVGKVTPADVSTTNSNHRPWICCHKQQLLCQY